MDSEEGGTWLPSGTRFRALLQTPYLAPLVCPRRSWPPIRLSFFPHFVVGLLFFPPHCMTRYNLILVLGDELKLSLLPNSV